MYILIFGLTLMYLQYKNQLILYAPSLVRMIELPTLAVNLLYNVCTYYRIYKN